jgi:sporulation protein YabP
VFTGSGAHEYYYQDFHINYKQRKDVFDMEDKKTVKRLDEAHNIIMENRKKISVSGAEEVESFNEETVVIFTNMGLLTIKGADLHINKLNIEAGDVAIEGEIYSFEYADAERKENGSQGFFSKIFKYTRGV